MFWSFVALLSFLGLAYRFVLGPERSPKYADYVIAGAFAMLAVMAAIWRTLLARGERSVTMLQTIDLLFATAIGLTFGASAVGQYDLQAAGYTTLIFTCFQVFTRALIVPSSRRRTAIVSAATFAPVIAAGVMLGLRGKTELPAPAYIGGGIMMCVIATIIAAQGSAIIYGLREKVDKAMRLGLYTLEEKIGEGGIGKVYRASHALLRRPTAIKLLQRTRSTPEDLARFEEEVQRTSELTHPNTVAIYDYGISAGGELYYAMEYLDGINLQDLVRRFGAQPDGRIVSILVQVCSALKEAHGRNLIHRDIKPANIILCERGGISDVAKVVDFGLVKDVTRSVELTGAQQLLGTPLYLAPEMVTDSNAASVVADIYAVGCVAYYLLAARPPFDAKSPMEIAVQHVTKPVTPPSELPAVRVSKELESVILACLAKVPAERPGSAAALIELLHSVPSQSDWSAADAERWWRDFRAMAAEPAPDPTALDTVTVDLENRQT
ncbi:MAG TPA: serine/threonine-protein kinase [Kofleriaceae bacterium]